MTDNITTEDAVKEFKLDTELHTNPNYNQLLNTEGKLASLKVGKPDNETWFMVHPEHQLELYILEAVVKINGTATLSSIHDFRNNNGRQASISNTAILDLAVSDYVELWGTVYDTSGSPQFGGGSSGGERYKSHLTGFKLIG